MQHESAPTQHIANYLEHAWRPPDETRQRLVELDALIDEIEILGVIKRCKRGKAVGPDGLSSDQWMREGVTPSSFASTNVHCIKKTATARAPLDHRSIALLNTITKSTCVSSPPVFGRTCL